MGGTIKSQKRQSSRQIRETSSGTEVRVCPRAHNAPKVTASPAHMTAVGRGLSSNSRCILCIPAANDPSVSINQLLLGVQPISLSESKKASDFGFMVRH